VGGEQFISGESALDRALQTSERLGTQEFVTGERLGAEAWGTGERISGQDWQSVERELDRDFTTGEREAVQVFTSDERIASQVWAHDESIDQRDWAAAEAVLGRTFTTTEREAIEDWNKGEREASERWTAAENVLGRTFTTEEREAIEAYGTLEREATQTWQEGEFALDRVIDQQIADVSTQQLEESIRQFGAGQTAAGIDTRETILQRNYVTGGWDTVANPAYGRPIGFDADTGLTAAQTVDQQNLVDNIARTQQNWTDEFDQSADQFDATMKASGVDPATGQVMGLDTSKRIYDEEQDWWIDNPKYGMDPIEAANYDFALIEAAQGVGTVELDEDWLLREMMYFFQPGTDATDEKWAVANAEVQKALQGLKDKIGANENVIGGGMTPANVLWGLGVLSAEEPEAFGAVYKAMLQEAFAQSRGLGRYGGGGNVPGDTTDYGSRTPTTGPWYGGHEEGLGVPADTEVQAIEDALGAVVETPPTAVERPPASQTPRTQRFNLDPNSAGYGKMEWVDESGNVYEEDWDPTSLPDRGRHVRQDKDGSITGMAMGQYYVDDFGTIIDIQAGGNRNMIGKHDPSLTG